MMKPFLCGRRKKDVSLVVGFHCVLVFENIANKLKTVAMGSVSSSTLIRARRPLDGGSGKFTAVGSWHVYMLELDMPISVCKCGAYSCLLV